MASAEASGLSSTTLAPSEIQVTDPKGPLPAKVTDLTTTSQISVTRIKCRRQNHRWKICKRTNERTKHQTHNSSVAVKAIGNAKIMAYKDKLIEVVETPQKRRRVDNIKEPGSTQSPVDDVTLQSPQRSVFSGDHSSHEADASGCSSTTLIPSEIQVTEPKGPLPAKVTDLMTTSQMGGTRRKCRRPKKHHWERRRKRRADKNPITKCQTHNSSVAVKEEPKQYDLDSLTQLSDRKRRHSSVADRVIENTNRIADNNVTVKKRKTWNSSVAVKEEPKQDTLLDCLTNLSDRDRQLTERLAGKYPKMEHDRCETQNSAVADRVIENRRRRSIKCFKMEPTTRNATVAKHACLLDCLTRLLGHEAAQTCKKSPNLELKKLVLSNAHIGKLKASKPICISELTWYPEQLDGRIVKLEDKENEQKQKTNKKTRTSVRQSVNQCSKTNSTISVDTSLSTERRRIDNIEEPGSTQSPVDDVTLQSHEAEASGFSSATLIPSEIQVTDPKGPLPAKVTDLLTSQTGGTRRKYRRQNNRWSWRRKRIARKNTTTKRQTRNSSVAVRVTGNAKRVAYKDKLIEVVETPLRSVDNIEKPGSTQSPVDDVTLQSHEAEASSFSSTTLGPSEIQVTDPKGPLPAKVTDLLTTSQMGGTRRKYRRQNHRWSLKRKRIARKNPTTKRQTRNSSVAVKVTGNAKRMAYIDKLIEVVETPRRSRRVDNIEEPGSTPSPVDDVTLQSPHRSVFSGDHSSHEAEASGCSSTTLVPSEIQVTDPKGPLPADLMTTSQMGGTRRKCRRQSLWWRGRKRKRIADKNPITKCQTRNSSVAVKAIGNAKSVACSEIQVPQEVQNSEMSLLPSLEQVQTPEMSPLPPQEVQTSEMSLLPCEEQVQTSEMSPCLSQELAQTSEMSPLPPQEVQTSEMSPLPPQEVQTSEMSPLPSQEQVQNSSETSPLPPQEIQISEMSPLPPQEVQTSGTSTLPSLLEVVETPRRSRRVDNIEEPGSTPSPVDDVTLQSPHRSVFSGDHSSHEAEASGCSSTTLVPSEIQVTDPKGPLPADLMTTSQMGGTRRKCRRQSLWWRGRKRKRIADKNPITKCQTRNSSVAVKAIGNAKSVACSEIQVPQEVQNSEMSLLPSLEQVQTPEMSPLPPQEVQTSEMSLLPCEEQVQTSEMSPCLSQELAQTSEMSPLPPQEVQTSEMSPLPPQEVQTSEMSPLPSQEQVQNSSETSPLPPQEIQISEMSPLPPQEVQTSGTSTLPSLLEVVETPRRSRRVDNIEEPGSTPSPVDDVTLQSPHRSVFSGDHSSHEAEASGCSSTTLVPSEIQVTDPKGPLPADLMTTSQMGGTRRKCRRQSLWWRGRKRKRIADKNPITKCQTRNSSVAVKAIGNAKSVACSEIQVPQEVQNSEMSLLPSLEQVQTPEMSPLPPQEVQTSEMSLLPCEEQVQTSEMSPCLSQELAQTSEMSPLPPQEVQTSEMSPLPPQEVQTSEMSPLPSQEQVQNSSETSPLPPQEIQISEMSPLPPQEVQTSGTSTLPSLQVQTSEMSPCLFQEQLQTSEMSPCPSQEEVHTSEMSPFPSQEQPQTSEMSSCLSQVQVQTSEISACLFQEEQTSETSPLPSQEVQTSEMFSLPPQQELQTSEMSSLPPQEAHISEMSSLPPQEVQTSEMSPLPHEEQVQTSKTSPLPIQEVQTSEMSLLPHEEQVQTSKTSPLPSQEVQTSEMSPVTSLEVQTSKMSPVPSQEVQTSKMSLLQSLEVQTSEISPLPPQEIQTSEMHPCLSQEAQTSEMSLLPHEEQVQTSKTSPLPSQEVQTTEMSPVPSLEVQTSEMSPVPSQEEVQTSKMSLLQSLEVQTSEISPLPPREIQTSEMHPCLSQEAQTSEMSHLPSLEEVETSDMSPCFSQEVQPSEMSPLPYEEQVQTSEMSPCLSQEVQTSEMSPLPYEEQVQTFWMSPCLSQEHFFFSVEKISQMSLLPEVQTSEMSPCRSEEAQTSEMSPLPPLEEVQTSEMFPCLSQEVQTSEMSPLLYEEQVQACEMSPLLCEEQVQTSETSPLPSQEVQSSEMSLLPEVQTSEMSPCLPEEAQTSEMSPLTSQGVQTSEISPLPPQEIQTSEMSPLPSLEELQTFVMSLLPSLEVQTSDISPLPSQGQVQASEMFTCLSQELAQTSEMFPLPSQEQVQTYEMSPIPPQEQVQTSEMPFCLSQEEASTSETSPLPCEQISGQRDLSHSVCSTPAIDSGAKQVKMDQPPEATPSLVQNPSDPQLLLLGLDLPISQRPPGPNSKPSTSTPSPCDGVKRNGITSSTDIPDSEPVELGLMKNVSDCLTSTALSDPLLSVPRTEGSNEGCETGVPGAAPGSARPVHLEMQKGSCDGGEKHMEQKLVVDRHFVCPLALRKIMGGRARSLAASEEEKEQGAASEELCRQSLSVVYSTIEENFPLGTLQFLSDLLHPGVHPPRDITSHLLRGILLEPRQPHHLCVQAYSLLMRTQRHHMANTTTVPWDWDLLTSVMANQNGAKSQRCVIVRMFLEYVLQTLEDDFQAKLSRSGLNQSIVKATLSCDFKFSHVRDVIKWLFAAIEKSTIDGDSRDEHIRMVCIFQKMLALALEVDRSPTLCSAKVAQELFQELISVVPFRVHRMLLLESLQSKLLRCKLLERLLDYSCRVKTRLPMSLSLLLHFMKNCTLPAMGEEERWQRWDELVQLLWMLLLSYNHVMKGNLRCPIIERMGNACTPFHGSHDAVSRTAVQEAVVSFLSRSQADIGHALPLDTEEFLYYLNDYLLDLCPKSAEVSAAASPKVSAVSETGSTKVAEAGSPKVAEVAEAGSPKVAEVAEAGSTKVSEAGSPKVAEVLEAGSTKVAEVSEAGSTKVAEVSEAGSTKVAEVSEAGAPELAEMSEAGSTKVSEVSEAGSTKVSEVFEVGSPKLGEVSEADAAKVAEVSEADAPELAEVLEAGSPKVSEVLEAGAPELAEVSEAGAPELAEVSKAGAPKKKGPGRPKGSRNKRNKLTNKRKKAAAASETPKRPKGRPKKPKPEGPKTPGKKGRPKGSLNKKPKKLKEPKVCRLRGRSRKTPRIDNPEGAGPLQAGSECGAQLEKDTTDGGPPKESVVAEEPESVVTEVPESVGEMDSSEQGGMHPRGLLGPGPGAPELEPPRGHVE